MTVAALSHAVLPRRRRVSVLAAVHPLTGGASHHNGAMVSALRSTGDVDLMSWRRMYPPLVGGRQERDEASRPPRVETPSLLLDWHAPRTWRLAVARMRAFGSEALVIPWIHPVSPPPYRWLLRNAPVGVRRVVICHNVVPHEGFRGALLLTRAVLRHADLLVTHAPHQRNELAALGLGRIALVEGSLPTPDADDLAMPPSRAAIAAERLRCGNPSLLLLAFGAVRPYKGIDLALEALARVDPALSVRLIVAGRFWSAPSRSENRSASYGSRTASTFATDT